MLFVINLVWVDLYHGQFCKYFSCPASYLLICNEALPRIPRQVTNFYSTIGNIYYVQMKPAITCEENNPKKIYVWKDRPYRLGIENNSIMRNIKCTIPEYQRAILFCGPHHINLPMTRLEWVYYV